jgi:hypothetical protein
MDRVKEFTDDELKREFAECQEQLEIESAQNPNSENHQNCFAAWYVMAGEMMARKLSTVQLH